MQNERDVEFTPDAGMDAAARQGGSRSAGAHGTTDGIADRAADTAHDVMDTARDVAAEARHRAAEEVQSRVSDQKHRAADSLGNVADSLRTASRQLGQDDGVSQYMVRAAEQVDNLASFLNSHEVSDLVDEVEHFARRQPAMFVGGAFALGVLGARFIKSSRRNLLDEGVREHWPTERMTSRVHDPRRDAVGRPAAPGYSTPARRGETDASTGGDRWTRE